MNQPARPDPGGQALSAVTSILAGLGRLLGKRVTVETVDGRQVTGRLSSAELASDGAAGAVLVWLSGQPDRVAVTRVVHEDADVAGIENTAGPKWLN